MITLTFDTLQFVQRLKKAGIKEIEAEAIAEAVRDVQSNTDATMTNLATKHDLDIKIAEIRRDLDVKIAETKAELVKWVVSVGVLQTAIIGALVIKLVPG